MNTRVKIAKILAGLALFLAVLVIGRAVYYSPVSEDSGQSATTTEVTQFETAYSGVLASVRRLTEEKPTDGEVDNPELPSRLIIPKLGIDTDVQNVGLLKNGNMGVPTNFTDVGWYKPGTVPGRTGSAVMAGHETNALGRKAIFGDLEKLSLGDDIYVVRWDGKKLHFKVVDEEIYPYDGGPRDRIFNAKDKARLNLITCAGNWLPSARTNDKRLVIYAELVN